MTDPVAQDAPFLLLVCGARRIRVPTAQVTRVLSAASCHVNPLPLPAAGVAGLLRLEGQPVPVLCPPRLCCARQAAQTSFVAFSSAEGQFAIAADEVLQESDSDTQTLPLLTAEELLRELLS